MAGYQSKNAKVIDNAVMRFRANAEKAIEAGIKNLALAGMSFLVEAHDSHREGMLHTEEDNTLAYAVAHDGTIIESGSFKGNGDDMPGDAMNKAKSLLSGTSGWVAIILSEMEGWYRVDWEQDFLHYSAEQVRQNFRKFFKPVK